MAAKYILNNIRKSFDTTAGLVSRIETFVEDSGLSLTLENFTNYYHLDVRNIYKRGTFSKLCVFAGAKMTSMNHWKKSWKMHFCVCLT
jgi:hypothetical protein